MPIPTFTKLGPNPQFQDLVNKINTIVAELINIMLNMDSLNVVSLTADHIDAGTLNAGVVTIRGEDGSVFYQIDSTGIVANNGTIDTLNFDLATGLLTLVSAIFKSATGFPRVEINSSDNLIAAYSSADDVLTISPFGPVSTPSVRLYNSDSSTVPRGSIYITEITGTTYFTFFGQEAVQLTSPDTWVNGPLRVNDFSDFSDGVTDLQTELDAKQDAFSGHTGSVVVVTSVDFGASTTTTSTLNFTNGVLTSVT